MVDAHTGLEIRTRLDLRARRQGSVASFHATRCAVTVRPSTLSLPVPSAFLDPVHMW